MLPTFRKHDDRRSETRRLVNASGLVSAPGLELGCAIIDISERGLRVRLSRNLALPERIMVIDMDEGLAREAKVVWRKGHEAGLQTLDRAPLRGLVPAKYALARDAWRRAGGR